MMIVDNDNSDGDKLTEKLIITSTITISRWYDNRIPHKTKKTWNDENLDRHLRPTNQPTNQLTDQSTDRLTGL